VDPAPDYTRVPIEDQEVRAMRAHARAAIVVLGFLAAVGAVSGQDWRGGRVRVDGIVKNEKGEPISGCKVSLHWGRSSHGGPALTTDPKGRWACLGLMGGPWDVDFEAAGYRPRRLSVELQESGRNPSIEVTLEAAQEAPAPAVEQRLSVAGRQVSKETAAAIEAGNQAMSARNFPLARESYVRALAELPDYGPLLERLAAACLGEGRSDDALRYARQAAEKDPGDYAAWRMIAEIELMKGNLEAGRAALDRIPPEKQTDPQAFLNVGILLLNQKKPAEAESALDKAVAVKPDLADGYYYRGLARLQQKKNAAARADLEKALELAPAGPDAPVIRDLLKSIP
jgi:Flp pilus assembly protein TadD